MSADSGIWWVRVQERDFTIGQRVQADGMRGVIDRITAEGLLGVTFDQPYGGVWLYAPKNVEHEV
jgi:hypothetical protein